MYEESEKRPPYAQEEVLMRIPLTGDIPKRSLKSSLSEAPFQRIGSSLKTMFSDEYNPKGLFFIPTIMDFISF